MAKRKELFLYHRPESYNLICITSDGKIFRISSYQSYRHNTKITELCSPCYSKKNKCWKKQEPLYTSYHSYGKYKNRAEAAKAMRKYDPDVAYIGGI